MPQFKFVKTVEKGDWMVLVPGAVAYLRYQGYKNPESPKAIYELLDELGFLEGIDRSQDSIRSTIRNRLRNQYKGWSWTGDS